MLSVIRTNVEILRRHVYSVDIVSLHDCFFLTQRLIMVFAESISWLVLAELYGTMQPKHSEQGIRILQWKEQKEAVKHVH